MYIYFPFYNNFFFLWNWTSNSYIYYKYSTIHSITEFYSLFCFTKLDVFLFLSSDLFYYTHKRVSPVYFACSACLLARSPTTTHPAPFFIIFFLVFFLAPCDIIIHSCHSSNNWYSFGYRGKDQPKILNPYQQLSIVC